MGTRFGRGVRSDRIRKYFSIRWLHDMDIRMHTHTSRILVTCTTRLIHTLFFAAVTCGIRIFGMRRFLHRTLDGMYELIDPYTASIAENYEDLDLPRIALL